MRLFGSDWAQACHGLDLEDDEWIGAQVGVVLENTRECQEFHKFLHEQQHQLATNPDLLMVLEDAVARLYTRIADGLDEVAVYRRRKALLLDQARRTEKQRAEVMARAAKIFEFPAKGNDSETGSLDVSGEGEE
jgi:hypothetical protein